MTHVDVVLATAPTEAPENPPADPVAEKKPARRRRAPNKPAQREKE